MLWACILLPQLALDTVLRGRDDADAPLVLLAGPAQRRVLQAVNGAAAALGLRAGQTLTAARALAEGFTCVEVEPARIEQVQQLLAAWAYRFSAQVSLHYPRALLLEVGSSLQLFGPWSRFEARLREELQALGLRHRIVLASNPVAARMLANGHDGLALTCPEQTRAALANMPLDRVGLPTEAAQALSRMGLHRLAQVQALPRDAVARRFAASVQLHLDHLFGLRALGLDFYQPPDRFESRLELNFDVESHQALLFPLRRLLNDLAAFLAGRDCGVQRFELHLEHVEGPDTVLKVGLLAAEREPAMLFELARGRLEPLRIAAPVRTLRLLAEDLPAFVPQHRALFDPRAQQAQPWEQLRERLRARLGDEAVKSLCAAADHRPEHAWQTAEQGAASGLVVIPGSRPGWLLSQAQALPESGVHWLGKAERIESGWWDGGDVRRDYYRIETRDGLRGWAYRDLAQPGPLWLQGWFA
ncbi:DNA polymerase Y family protein [Pseudomonas parafulva]|uniref:DNA polymerase Y family protein n=1 Tax=Pseudomonas parafulva TaxID=157782 RepID=A0AAI8KBB1_9PSED|nr:MULTISPECIES: DNA polymerase Y family protein [Pseudomonas]AIZ32531.1 DNA repair nucleotidyltransferase [Pseudomonas parafulva]AXO88038.1 DNA polymerase Y family protein [Pseudomonas parafulva]MDV9030618.1 DNA polymerase Y family protein [Pseudomonas sp. RAC1]